MIFFYLVEENALRVDSADVEGVVDAAEEKAVDADVVDLTDSENVNMRDTVEATRRKFYYLSFKLLSTFNISRGLNIVLNLFALNSNTLWYEAVNYLVLSSCILNRNLFCVV